MRLMLIITNGNTFTQQWRGKDCPSTGVSVEEGSVWEPGFDFRCDVMDMNGLPVQNGSPDGGSHG